MFEKYKEHQLFFRLLSLFIIVICAQTLIVSYFIYSRSKEAYINSFNDSNTIILKKIQSDFEIINNNIEQLFTRLDNNAVVEAFFSNNNNTPEEEFRLSKEIQTELSQTKEIYHSLFSNLVIFGENKKSFYQNAAVASMTTEEVLQSELFQQVNENNASTQMVFKMNGFSVQHANTPGILFIKKLRNKNYHTYAYVTIFIPSENLANVFTSLLNPEVSQISIIDQNNQIIAATSSSEISKKLPENLRNLPTNQLITRKNYQYYHLPIYGLDISLINRISLTSLVTEMNVIQPTIIIISFSIILVGIFIFIFLNRNTQAIYRLVNSVKATKEKEFNHQVKVEGTYEIQVLATTINRMLKDLHDYFINYSKKEKEKRLFEFQAMQAQIHPHFIYNTLTSIKFLIWQGESNKAVIGIDNFIVLLRSTIGKQDEIVTIEEEMRSVKSYIEVLSLRFGDKISTSFIIPDELLKLKVPKMIIQPIIENAYLHAFDDYMEGYISIFVRQNDNLLIIDIIDNGVGFKESQPKNNKRHFSGIGMKNVDERIKLMFGNAYGLSVKSELSIGTTISFKLPLIEDTNEIIDK